MNKMKTENEIKDLLKKKFDGVGNFQQTEFNSGGGSSRRDFVILGDDYFHYYEIKTEKDSFIRLPAQISNAVGLFTKMFIVAPTDKIWKLRKMGVNVGLLAITQLENGVKKDIELMYGCKQKVDWRLSIEKVMEVLWANDLRNLIDKKKPNIKGIRRMDVANLQKIFLAHYSDDDCFTILNKTLNTERYDWRKTNKSKNQ